MSVEVTVILDNGRSLKEEVDSEIAAFEEWFRSYLKNAEPLSKTERAILTDYLGWKVHG